MVQTVHAIRHHRHPPFPVPHRNRVLWTLLCLLPLVGMAIDLITPSLPAISYNLNISHQSARNAISIYMLGYALGNFFIGFLSDAIGRRLLICLSLLVFAIVSILPILFPNGFVLHLTRLLQGLSLGGFALLTRTIFSDILTSDELVSIGTLMATMWGLGPIIGPILGGYLQQFFGWQAGFYFFSIFSGLGFLVTFVVIPETHIYLQPLSIRNIRSNLIEIFTHQLFMSMVLLTGLLYSLIIIFNTVGPFLIERTLKHSPVFFGHLSFLMGITFLISTTLCRYILKKHALERLYFYGFNTFFLLAIFCLIISYFLPYSLTVIILATMTAYFCSGFLFPPSMAKGISFFQDISGAASAGMFLVNISITCIASFISSFLDIHSSIPLLTAYVILIFCCTLVYWLIIRKNKAQL